MTYNIVAINLVKLGRVSNKSRATAFWKKYLLIKIYLRAMLCKCKTIIIIIPLHQATLLPGYPKFHFFLTEKYLCHFIENNFCNTRRDWVKVFGTKLLFWSTGKISKTALLANTGHHVCLPTNNRKLKIWILQSFLANSAYSFHKLLILHAL